MLEQVHPLVLLKFPRPNAGSNGVSGHLTFSSGTTSSGSSGELKVGTGTATKGKGGSISITVGTGNTIAGGVVTFSGGKADGATTICDRRKISVVIA